jgi:phospholipid/cholesterol/gamma-HCH transport system permease protein
MLRYLRLLGQWALGWIGALGRASMVWFQSIAGLPRRGDMTLLLKQIYQIGVLSLIIIVLSAFSIGAVLALQGYTQLARVGAEESVGLGVALVLLRELGPVVTGLLFAGRAGSAVTAEIGLMKATGCGPA